MVERYVRDVEATGSNPATSTRQSLEPFRAPGSFLFVLKMPAFMAGIFFSPCLQAEPGAVSRSKFFLSSNGDARDYIRYLFSTYKQKHSKCSRHFPYRHYSPL